jgi:hypothetical protein
MNRMITLTVITLSGAHCNLTKGSNLFDGQRVHGEIDAAVKIGGFIEAVDDPHLEERNLLRSDQNVVVKNRSHFFHQQLLQVTVKSFTRNLYWLKRMD